MDEIRGLVEQLIGIVTEMTRNGQRIAPEIQAQLTQVLSAYADRLEAEQRPIEEPITAPIPQGADLLWILAGGDPKVFTQYLQNIPDPELNQLSKNPVQLQQIINRLDHQVTIPHGETEEGIPRAPLQSSNVYGYSYNPRSNRMYVRFNSGSVYEYENVPPAIFKAFQRFSVPAKTSGSNRWGQWWRGKVPSVGSSFHEIIKNGPFPYQKVA